MSNSDAATIVDLPDELGEHTPPDAEDGGPGDDSSSNSETSNPRRRFRWQSLLIFGFLPVIVIALAAVAAYLKFEGASLRDAAAARQQAVQAATEGTIAMLSYGPDNVDATLRAAESRLTGPFRDSYTALVNDVVIPGAKQQKISATATVPAAAPISATRAHADVIVYVNQATIIGADAPTDTASVVEVTLDKVGDTWLISGFTPR